MDIDALSTRLTELLAESGEDSASWQLLTLAVDDLLETPGKELLDPELLVDHLLIALRSEGPKLSADRHLEVALECERDRVSKSGEILGVAVPEEVVAGIEARLGRPTDFPKGFGKDIVDPAFIRQLIAGALAETLEAFLGKLPFGGGGKDGDSGLLGSIARKGASRLKSASSALSSIGAGMQDGLKRQAKEFAQQSADVLKQGVIDRFNSKENKVVLKEMRRRAVDAVLGLQFSDIHAFADDPGIETLREWGDLILQHNLKRPEIEEALREQVKLALGREEDRTIKEWLVEHDLYESVRNELIRVAAQRANQVAQSDVFESWLTSLLAAAMK